MSAIPQAPIVAGPESAGRRLDVFLSEKIPGLSRAQAQKCIDEGRVTVNRKPSKKHDRLKTDDVVAVEAQRIDEILNPTLIPQNIALDILYEDDHLIAVNKPAGMVVHPGHGNREGTLVNALLYRMPKLSDGFAEDRPGIVHRIDKDTSGIVLAAKTNVAHAALASLFASRDIEKQYAGFCVGDKPRDHEIISAPISRSRMDPIKYTVNSRGKEAITEYQCMASRSGVSAMHFHLHTGRTHQIRVHCAYRKFPIIGDEMYGERKATLQAIPPLDRPFAAQVVKCFRRQALHAFRIRFRHPASAEMVTVTAPFPEDFKKAFACFKIDECELLQE
jgi:23S rRNA pseudouridine1911/1915/1917 synthase